MIGSNVKRVDRCWSLRSLLRRTGRRSIVWNQVVPSLETHAPSEAVHNELQCVRDTCLEDLEAAFYGWRWKHAADWMTCASTKCNRIPDVIMPCARPSGASHLCMLQGSGH